MLRTSKRLVTFLPHKITVQVSEGVNILEAARLAHIFIATSCGGQRDCGLCRVIVLEGATSNMTPEEYETLSELQIHDGNRLACCTRVLSNLTIWLPADNGVNGESQTK